MSEETEIPQRKVRLSVEPSVEPDRPVHHILPKKPGERGRTEVHCLEDACIMVRVSSSQTFLGRRQSHEKSVSSRISDGILEAYARKSQRLSNDVYESEDRNLYDNYNFFDQEEETEDKQQQHDFRVSRVSLALGDCSPFLDTVTFAKELVDHVVKESEANVEYMAPDSTNEIPDEDDHAYAAASEEFTSAQQFPVIEKQKPPNTMWPTVQEFTVELGAYSIDDYLSSFDTEEDWMYVIYYQGQQESACSVLHKYQAIYSLPTWKYPIAQATASIYFVIEACKVKPPHCFVDVTYQYESFRQVHKPGDLDFSEKWLHYILDSKIKFFQTIIY